MTEYQSLDHGGGDKFPAKVMFHEGCFNAINKSYVRNESMYQSQCVSEISQHPLAMARLHQTWGLASMQRTD